MPLQIIEILGPSEQGTSCPYRCRAEDGQIYFVKGRQTTRACLWHEWICGHLAQRFGLRVPPFDIVEICPELLDEAPAEWRCLGVGLAFGSRLHPSALWMDIGTVNRVPAAVQRDVLVFDWWIRNGDRLTYNTNLLWDAQAQELVVIDHNLAFDRNLSDAAFLEHHVFATHWSAICSDMVEQAQYAERLSSALEGLAADCDNVPPEWQWANVDMDIPAKFDLNHIQNTLARCASPELWRTTV